MTDSLTIGPFPRIPRGQRALPEYVRLLTQRITVTIEPNLHAIPEGQTVAATDGHAHRAYGIYNEADQTMSIDDDLGFERERETFLHENIHALIAATQLDTMLADEMPGFDEHFVSALAPIMLSWIRENPATIAYLQETQA